MESGTAFRCALKLVRIVMKVSITKFDPVDTVSMDIPSRVGVKFHVEAERLVKIYVDASCEISIFPKEKD